MFNNNAAPLGRKEDRSVKSADGSISVFEAGARLRWNPQPGTANARGRGTRETSRDKAAEVRAGLAEAALQDATARQWIKLRPPGFGVRLSLPLFDATVSPL
jgi:hypothetical protein